MNRILLAIISFYLIAAPRQSYACIGPPIEVEVFKAKERVSVHGQNIYFIVPKDTAWKVYGIDIELVSLINENGVTRYTIKRGKNALGGDKGEVFFNNGHREVRVDLTLPAMTRGKTLTTNGGCGNSNLSYDAVDSDE